MQQLEVSRKMQDVETLFRNIRDIKGEIIAIKKHEEQLRLSMLPGAIRYDKDNVNSSPQDPMLMYAERISDDEEKIKKRLKRLQHDSDIAQKVLDGMTTSKYRTILFLRYMEGGLQYRYSWREIAINIGYAEQYTRQDLHRLALEEAQKVYDSIKK